MSSWSCSCGFVNKPTNEQCGGNGPMGCNAPRPSGGGGKGLRGISPALKGGSTGPSGGNYGAIRTKGMANGGGKGASPYGAATGGKWPCLHCGFQNSPMNEVCGGKGPMGCKAPNPKAQAAPAVEYQWVQIPVAVGGNSGKGKGGGPPADRWTCTCGFNNRPNNDVCGGANGTLGCKQPRPENAWSSTPPLPPPKVGAYGMPSWAAPPVVAWVPPVPTGIQSQIKGKGGKGKGRTWTCPSCGFENQEKNQECGGAGPLGCKEPKPGKWECPCGFVNSPTNEVCGGKGPMGCKEPRPVEDTDE